MTKKKKTRRLVGDIPDLVPRVSLGETMRNLLPEEYEEERPSWPHEQPHASVDEVYKNYGTVKGALYNPMALERIECTRIKPLDVKLSPEMELFLKRIKEAQDEFLHALSSTRPYKDQSL